MSDDSIFTSCWKPRLFQEKWIVRVGGLNARAQWPISWAIIGAIIILGRK